MSDKHWKSTWNMYYPKIDNEVSDWTDEINRVLKRDPGTETISEAIRNMRDDPDVNKFPRVGELISAIRDVIYGKLDDNRPVDQCDPCNSSGWLSVVKAEEGVYVTGACLCYESIAVPCVCSEGRRIRNKVYPSEVDRQGLQRMAQSAMDTLEETGGVCPLECKCKDMPATNTVAGFGRVSDEV